MAKPKVIIVAGHGGGDPGSIARGRTEAAEAIDITNRTVKCLRADGRVTVVVVPHNLNMQGGIDWINKQAGALNDDILALSVHKNSFSQPAYGYETWAGETSFSTKRVRDFHTETVKRNDLKDRGIKDHKTRYSAGLGFIRDTKFEAILTENGFMQTDHFNNDKYAAGICAGVLSYYGLGAKPQATPSPKAKYYRVFNAAGKQLGAYSTQKNAWEKYVSIGRKGKITGLDDSDITQVLINQYDKPLVDVHVPREELETVKTELRDLKQRTVQVEKKQNLIVSVFKAIGDAIARLFR